MSSSFLEGVVIPVLWSLGLVALVIVLTLVGTFLIRGLPANSAF